MHMIKAVSSLLLQQQREKPEKFRPGVRFSKDPKTLRARKAIRKTPTRLFCKAGLFICCKGSKS